MLDDDGLHGNAVAPNPNLYLLERETCSRRRRGAREYHSVHYSLSRPGEAAALGHIGMIGQTIDKMLDRTPKRAEAAGLLSAIDPMIF